MRVDLRMVTEDPRPPGEVERLRAVYGTFERLWRRVRVQGCADPDAVDDLELWTALRGEGCTVERVLTYRSSRIFGDLTPRRMDLLHRLTSTEYASIRSLADDCGRDYKNVYEDLVALERWGLVDMTRTGRSVRPTTRISELRVRLE